MLIFSIHHRMSKISTRWRFNRMIDISVKSPGKLWPLSELTELPRFRTHKIVLILSVFFVVVISLLHGCCFFVLRNLFNSHEARECGNIEKIEK